MAPLINLTDGRTQTIATVYTVIKFLGKGSFAEVYHGYHKFKNMDLALKIYTGNDERTEAIARGEFEILSKLQALNTDYFPKPEGRPLVKIDNKYRPMVTMELCEYIENNPNEKQFVSLKDIMPEEAQDKKPDIEIPRFWDKDTLFNFIDELCNAVRLMHNNEIIHRDLKPSNILLKKPSGGDTIKPFLLDFNTSVRSGSNMFSGGTENYLPPEVRSGKSTTPKPSDDLWSVGVIIWELIFGVKQKICQGLSPHKFIKNDVSDDFVKILLKSLSERCEDRYSDTAEFYAAIHDCITSRRNAPDDISTNELMADEIEWANENNSRIKKDILETLSGENEIPVIKEIKNNVANIYTFVAISDSETRSLNLKDDILRLGPDAIPSIIEEGYRVSSGTKEFNEITDALVELSGRNKPLAKRSIEIFCSSSDYNVRKMCQVLCQKMCFFPSNLIQSILDDAALYLPDERINIADLCIRYSTSSDVLLPLNNYLCREYILDPQNYFKLKDNIASRINDLQFEEKARLIVEDTKMRIWEDLPEYEKLDDNRKEDMDKGLLQLFADSFASLKDNALEYIKNEELPSKCDNNKLKISSTFISRLAQNHPQTRSWLFETLKNKPTRDLLFAARNQRDLSQNEKNIYKKAARELGIAPQPEVDVEMTFQNYLQTGSTSDRNLLRFDQPDRTLSMVARKMTSNPEQGEILNILKLLKEFKNDSRIKTTKIVCDNWNKFSEIDHGLTVEVISNYSIPDAEIKRKTLALLNGDLDILDRRNRARNGIDLILRRD